MSLLGGLLDGVGDVVGDLGEAVGDVVELGVAGALTDIGEAVSNVGAVVTGVATDAGRILAVPTTEDADPPPSSTSKPTPTPTVTSSSRPPSSTTTRVPTASSPSPSQPAPPPPQAPPEAPPSETSTTPSPSNTPPPQNDVDGEDEATSTPASPGGGSNIPEGDNGNLSSSLPPPQDTPGTIPLAPASSGGSITPPISPSNGPSSPAEPTSSVEGARTSSPGLSKAVVGSLSAIGALLALGAILCLLRIFFIRRRCAKRDAWAIPITWDEKASSGYAATWVGSEKALVAMPRVETSFESHSDLGGPVPAGWIDVESATTPTRPLVVTNQFERSSVQSVRSYGKLTHEELFCHRPSLGASTLSSGSAASAISTVTVPAAAAIASRWSPETSRHSGQSALSDVSASSGGSASSSDPFLYDGRLSLAYLTQSTGVDTPSTAPEDISIASPKSVSPITPGSVDRQDHNPRSALMSALFAPPRPAQTSMTARKSVPIIAVATSNSPTERERSRSPDWTPPESWGSTVHSPSSLTFGGRAHEPPTIVVTSPRSHKSASGLFVDEDPFASPLDRAN